LQGGDGVIGIEKPNSIGHTATILTFTLLCLSMTAHAQSPDAPSVTPAVHQGQGYLFLAPGAYVGYSDALATIHFGGGAEAFLYKGVAAGAEAGGIWALRGSDLLGVLSVDGSYHLSRSRRISPFLTCGYSLLWGDGRRNLINFGAGVHWWLGSGKGIRLEFRDHVYADGTNRQIVEFRIGFEFH
jgi:hypothetical protein